MHQERSCLWLLMANRRLGFWGGTWGGQLNLKGGLPVPPRATPLATPLHIAYTLKSNAYTKAFNTSTSCIILYTQCNHSLNTFSALHIVCNSAKHFLRNTTHVFLHQTLCAKTKSPGIIGKTLCSKCWTHLAIASTYLYTWKHVHRKHNTNRSEP